VRTSSSAQSDLVAGLGATPVDTPFAEMPAQMRSGNIQCAITGTMSGHTIGLHREATHVYPLPISWGVTLFVANGKAWQALPEALRTVLRRELPALERRVWDESERETAEGLNCNVGHEPCGATGPRGTMTAPALHPGDSERLRDLLRDAVLPRWLLRCGADCAQAWNATLAQPSGVPARSP
jgi:Bacterial extracellular solute-binding protein, family 7